MISVTPACLCWILVSVGFMVLASEEQKAETGQDVTLPCPAPQGKNIRILKWSRADLGDKDVFLFRDGGFVSANQHPSFKDRVDLKDKQVKDLSLIVKNVTAADDGEYRCAVFLGETRSWEQINSATLRVSEPPGSEGGSVGLIVGLSVAAVVAVAAAVGGFVGYRKYKQSQGPYQRPNGR